jgi:hypothetical protein
MADQIRIKPKGITPAKMTDHTRDDEYMLSGGGLGWKRRTNRNSLMDGEWVHDGLIIEGKHAVKGIHELDLYKENFERLAFERHSQNDFNRPGARLMK